MNCQHCQVGRLDPQNRCEQCGRTTESIAVIGLTGSLAITLTGYGILAGIVALAVPIAMSRGQLPTVAFELSFLLTLLIGLVVFLLAIVVHELVHGLSMRLLGARARYGVGMVKWWMPYAYATAPGHPFTANQMVIVALAPLVVLSVASVVVMALVPALAGYAAVVFVGNAAGAVGDLWLVGRVLRFARCRDVRMVDIKDKMAIYSADPAAIEVVRRIDARERQAIVGPLVVCWMLMAVTIVASGAPLMFVLAAMGISQAVVGPESFALFVFGSATGHGPDWVTVYPVPVLVASFLLALPVALTWRRRLSRAGKGEPPVTGTPRPAFI